MMPSFASVGFAHHPESAEDHYIANDQLFRCARAGTHWVPVPNREAGRLQVCCIA